MSHGFVYGIPLDSLQNICSKFDVLPPYGNIDWTRKKFKLSSRYFMFRLTGSRSMNTPVQSVAQLSIVGIYVKFVLPPVYSEI